MNKFEFVLNKEGVSELLKSQEMQDVLKKHAEATQQGCGMFGAPVEDYSCETKISATRAVSVVRADTRYAQNSCLKHNTILKALK